MTEVRAENGILVQLGEPFFHGGDLAIRIVRRVDTETLRVARVNSQGGWLDWEERPRNGLIEGATIVMTDEVARALLDALIRHYQGASDMHTVRADLLHERKRVDELTGALIGLASKSIETVRTAIEQ